MSTHFAVSGLPLTVCFRNSTPITHGPNLANSINLVANGQKLNTLYLKKTVIAEVITAFTQWVLEKLYTYDSSSI